MSRLTNLVFSLIMIGVCATALFAGGKWLLAEHHRDKAIRLITEWKANQAVPLEEWESAAASMSRALELHESRANLHYFLGYLYELRLAAPYPLDESLSTAQQQQEQLRAAADYLGRAIRAYHESLKRGPSLPDTWSRLALVKQSLGEFDQEFIVAYGSTYMYGRNVSGLHLALTDLSLRFFPQIRENANLRTFQSEHLRNVMTRGNSKLHVDLMSQYGRLAEVCNLVGVASWTRNSYSARACNEAFAGNALFRAQ